MIGAGTRIVRMLAPTPSSIGALGRGVGRAGAAVLPVTAGARNLLPARIGVVAALAGRIGQCTIGGTYIDRSYQNDSKITSMIGDLPDCL
jgi:hypothetical protein